MIILARYCRYWRIPRIKREMKGYKYWCTYLFDKVYWLWRDHCWIEWVRRRKMVKWGRHIIRWNKQHYIDSKWESKISVLPTGKLQIFPNNEKWYCNYRHYYKKVRKLYNIYIKNPLYGKLYSRHNRNKLLQEGITWSWE